MTRGQGYYRVLLLASARSPNAVVRSNGAGCPQGIAEGGAQHPVCWGMAWVEELEEKHGAPGVKQQLATVRMLFDWLITGQVVPTNPAAAVRGPKYVVTTGKTPVLDGSEWRRLLNAIPTETVRDLRDRALIGTLTYSFARVGAALKLKVEDLRPNGTGWQIHLHEKGEGAQDALPSRVIGNAARLCCRGQHR
jgi:integrase